LAEDMFSTGYVGGTGTEFFTDYSDMEEYNNGTKSRHKSIFAMLAPYSDVEYANPVDITGKYSGDTEALNVDGNDHFASAAFYSRGPQSLGLQLRMNALKRVMMRYSAF
jgi:hypothetical protein